MSNGEKDQQKKPVTLTVSADFIESEREEKRPQGFAYAFSSGGRLLAREALDPQGTANLTLSASTEGQEVRVVVGPEAVEEEDEENAISPEEQRVVLKAKIRAADLLRRGAVEELVRIDPNDLRPSVKISIFPESWRCWVLSRCLVRGTLLKRVGYNSLPICNATVEIYEVDPISVLLPKLPDFEIERIRDFIINPPPPPPPPIEIFKNKIKRVFPPPSSGPFFEETQRLSSLSPESSFMPMAMQTQRASQSVVASHSHASAREMETASSAIVASTELQSLARTARDTFQFRQVLINHALSIRHLLCIIRPRFVTMRRIATVRTDRCGHFQTYIYRGCYNTDTPDLYFKARQRLFPILPPTYIYAPTPIACYTYWNYACGTRVTLYATNPDARACAPCPDDNIPDKGVVVKAIGNILINEMFGTSTTSPTPVTADNLGLLHDGRPWGGMLRLRLDFDPALRNNNIKYYRVSQRRGTSGGWTPLILEIHRYYTTFGTSPSEVLYPVGPQAVGTTPNLFEIPPTLPPVSGATWTIRDLYEETIHAKFNSVATAPGQPPESPDQSGKFQIKIDLYDGAGNLIDIDTEGVAYYVPTATDPAPAVPLGLVVDDDGDGKKSFIMTVHVDNNPCDAEIMAPTLNGASAGSCGILEYTGDPPIGTVTMNYRAFHRNRFANYEFSVVRGATPVTIPGEPPGYVQVPPSPGTATASATVNDLLAGCPAAGFVEQLDVDGMATDGITGVIYSAYTVFAFALAPEGILPEE